MTRKKRERTLCYAVPIIRRINQLLYESNNILWRSAAPKIWDLLSLEFWFRFLFSRIRYSYKNTNIYTTHKHVHTRVKFLTVYVLSAPLFFTFKMVSGGRGLRCVSLKGVVVSCCKRSLQQLNSVMLLCSLITIPQLHETPRLQNQCLTWTCIGYTCRASMVSSGIRITYTNQFDVFS